MIKKVLDYQRQLGLIEDGDRIVAGFSGGADSVCLLLILEELKKQWDFSYCAVHVEHGIRGEESLQDSVFAENFCKERQIPFFIYHVDAVGEAKSRGLSLEEAARELRYQCFELAKEEFQGNKVAVAHHEDDNAETMLFHLIRGTGLAGLGGIQPKREHLIRPLLCVTRKEIEAYLEEKEISYCTDSTNEDVNYSRNRIRRQVIPQLELVNEKAVEHLSKVSREVTEIYDFIRNTAWEMGSKGFCREDGQIVLNKEVICSLEPVLQKEFLYQALCLAADNKKDITSVHVECLRQLFFAQTSKQVSLPYGLTGVAGYETVRIKKENQRENEKEEQLIPLALEELCSLTQALELPDGLKIYFKVFGFDGDYKKIPEKTYTKWFDYDKIRGNVFLRNRRPGDYIVINQQGNQKKLKEYFVHEKVPKDSRDQIWLLADGTHIVWVVGYRISEAYKITKQTKRILEVRVEENDPDERNNSCNVHRGTDCI